ncbi:hypothetical protein GS501_02975 [Saccharibacter sp. 17.LH.SD]|nr:hypothetical protein [Saccharibacter sp. 17.LH.SD]
MVRHDISHLFDKMDNSKAIGAIRDLLRPAAVRFKEYRSPEECQAPMGRTLVISKSFIINN